VPASEDIIKASVLGWRETAEWNEIGIGGGLSRTLEFLTAGENEGRAAYHKHEKLFASRACEIWLESILFFQYPVHHRRTQIPPQ
jgi:hypothetical protein